MYKMMIELSDNCRQIAQSVIVNYIVIDITIISSCPMEYLFKIFEIYEFKNIYRYILALIVHKYQCVVLWSLYVIWYNI